ncbi:HD domain-containing protein [Fontimonas sp. SYSU GA230001]|uniref:HD domain-containing protein n=1 Tax=Fontimonas sp. SYSU GA230001 TaxID=3142450 RepID=UPI0032B5527A
MTQRRRNHYDVTDTVRISHPRDVYAAVGRLLTALYPDLPLAPLQRAFDTFSSLYAGTLPGYVGCDTWYHDAQHSLDCALAMARLLDGYEREVPASERLGPRRATLGIIIALFHDAGYIRRTDDAARNGAEYTLTHVRRSGDFLAGFLPTVGFGAEARLASRLVHFTGYEIALDQIRVAAHKDRLLGFMLGTADILAQTADRCYLEKCRDFLFREFSLCGLAGDGHRSIYRSAQDLLEKTPEFNRRLWDERLDGYFQGIHRYLDAHFGGPNPYVQTIDEHLKRVARLTRQGRLGDLRRRPQAINAERLRRIVGSSRPRRPLRAAPRRTATLARGA